jgi:hypothetical protein
MTTTLVRGRKIVGVTVTPAIRTAREPTREAKNRKMLADAAVVVAANLILTAPVQDVEAEAVAALANVTAVTTLAIQTVPNPTQDEGTVGMVLAASTTMTREPAAPAKGAGARVQAETEEEVTTRKATAGIRIRRTKEAAVVYPLRDAAGHPADGISEDINQGTPSQARCCKAWSIA